MCKEKNVFWKTWFQLMTEEMKERNLSASEYSDNGVYFELAKGDISAYLTVVSDNIFNNKIKYEDRIGFNFNDRLHILASLYVDMIVAKHDDVESYRMENIYREIKETIDNMIRDFQNYVNDPSWSQQIVKNMLLDIERQENPENRVITKTTCKKREGINGVDVFDVYITSNCDGWAETEDKLIGETFNKDLCLDGKTESEAGSMLTSINMLAEGLKRLDEIGTVNTNCFWEVSDGEEFINYLSGLACDLIDSSGRSADYNKVLELENLIGESESIDVYPGEQDSFGWLTGILNFKGGQIVFG